MTIRDALGADENTPVTLTGTVKKAFDLKSGEGRKGPWSVLEFVLADSTGEIKVKWWEPTIKSGKAIEGLTVAIAPVKGKGAFVIHDSFNNKTTVKVNARGGCVSFPVEGVEAAPAGAQAVAGNAGKFASAQAAPTMTAYFAAMRRAMEFFTQELGLSDQAALGAALSTVGIALTNGRLVDDAAAVPVKQASGDDYAGEPEWDTGG